MIVSNSNLSTIRKAIVAQDKTIQEDHLPLYKELDIPPGMFGYLGTWEEWEEQYLPLTLTKAERETLRTAIIHVAALNRPLPTFSYSRPRLSSTSQAILSKVGLSPISLGISIATDWKNY